MMTHNERVRALRMATRLKTYAERIRKGHLVRPVADEMLEAAYLLEAGCGVDSVERRRFNETEERRERRGR